LILVDTKYEFGHGPDGRVMNRSSGPRIAVCFRHLGPYHRARLRAATAREPLVAIEFCSVDDTYGWNREQDSAGFDTVTLFDDAEIRAAALRSAKGNARPRAARSIGRGRPRLVASAPSPRRMVLAQAPAGRADVTSTAHDRRRRWWREAVRGGSLRPAALPLRVVLLAPTCMRSGFRDAVFTATMP
jgi:hypothetical protein